MKLTSVFFVVTISAVAATEDRNLRRGKGPNGIGPPGQLCKRAPDAATCQQVSDGLAAIGVG